MVSRIARVLFIVWVVLWIVFTVREAFIKGQVREYAELIGRSLDGKRSYVTGDRLYAFLTFAAGVVPEGETYRIVGLEDGSLDKRRAVYYLYPRTESPEPVYLLVYDYAGDLPAGYATAARLDAERFVLKRNTK